MFEAKVLTTSTSYSYDDLPVRYEYEVEVKMGGNVIGIYTGENDFEDAYEWAVHGIKWAEDQTESVNVGHDYAYEIADAITMAAGT